MQMTRPEPVKGNGGWLVCTGLVLALLISSSTAIAAEKKKRKVIGPPPLVVEELPVECAGCHKPDGRGGPGYGGFAANLHETQLDHAGLVEVITAGRQKLGMPTFKAVLSKRKISAIATFIIEHFKGKPIVGELKE